MKKLVAGAALLAALTLTLAACGSSNNSPSGSGSGGTAAPNQPAAGGGLMATSTPLGTLLTDSSGRTLYALTKDQNGTSSCYGACANTWPAFTVSGTPTAGSGVTSSMIATSKRTDGKMQVTYKNQPLYFFSGDANAGDTNGQGSGGVWFTVAPTGSLIKSTAGAGGAGAAPTTTKY